MERLTDWLEDRPLMSARLERRQTNAGEPVVVAQIRDPGEGISHRHRSRGNPCVGAIAASARYRYHSAHPVASQSAK
jgi:hypothetical protein